MPLVYLKYQFIAIHNFAIPVKGWEHTYTIIMWLSIPATILASSTNLFSLVQGSHFVYYIVMIILQQQSSQFDCGDEYA